MVVGGFFGDEGKGKVLAHLALTDKPSISARGGVGPNAGHSVEYEGKVYGLRMLPSAFVNKACRLLIGPGVAVNPDILFNEIKATGTEGRVGIDSQCAIIEEKHIRQEATSEHLAKKIGSTKSGVGACNAERTLRTAKLARDLPPLSKLIVDVSAELNRAISDNQKVLIEGTQGTYLSLYYGTYPYCTAKDVTASAICSDVGVGPTAVDEVIVVFKSYVTRVGEGPLAGELPREETIKRGWMEKATVTGRERRSAPFNFDLAKRAVMINGATQIAITKLDVMFPDSRNLKNFSELPREARSFVEEVAERLGVPVGLIGTGPATDSIIDRRTEFSER